MTDKPFDPKQDIYPKTSHENMIVRRATKVAGYFAATTILISIMLAIFRYTHTQIVVYGFAVAWALGAPTWFFYEYFFLYRKSGVPGSWDLFKHGQQVAIAIWAGLTASLTVFASSDLVKPDTLKLQCELEVPVKATSAGTSLLATCKKAP